MIWIHKGERSKGHDSKLWHGAPTECAEVITRKAAAARVVEATAMNAVSSRSHSGGLGEWLLGALPGPSSLVAAAWTAHNCCLD